MHPAKEGFSALPFFDEFDLSTVDILLISQYVGFDPPFPARFGKAPGNRLHCIYGTGHCPYHQRRSPCCSALA